MNPECPECRMTMLFEEVVQREHDVVYVYVCDDTLERHPSENPIRLGLRLDRWPVQSSNTTTNNPHKR